MAKKTISPTIMSGLTSAGTIVSLVATIATTAKNKNPIENESLSESESQKVFTPSLWYWFMGSIGSAEFMSPVYNKTLILLE